MESAAGMLPAERPPLTREMAIDLAADAGLTSARTPGAAFLFGRRGYFPAMGKGSGNDINVYDDCWAIVSPAVDFATFNANTDPCKRAPGIATLQPGIWLMKETVHHPGTPKAHPCLGQASPVVVHRDGTESHAAGEQHATYGTCQGDGLWRGMFNIQCHCGFYNETGSEGCQTAHPDQWSAERANPGQRGPFAWPSIKAALDANGGTLRYVLTVANA